MNDTLAGASPVDQPVMPLAPERAAFVAWMRDFANVADNYWMRDPKIGEHDAALSAWLYQQREIDRLRAALLQCARQAEALKRECGSDPESAQAVRNGQYQAISTAAHVALGTIRGPSWDLRMPKEAIAMLWNSLPIDMEAEAIVSFVRGVERYHGIGA